MQRSDKLLLLALLLLNAALKSCWLGSNELDGDEPFTVYWALQPLDRFVEMLRTENNPPLYFLLMKGWCTLVPLEEAWLRIPSAVFSILTVWPLFLLGRALSGRSSAVIACLLFTLNNHQYGFAHEVRAYSLLLLLCTCACWLVIRHCVRAHTHMPASFTPLATILALLVWTHFFGWLIIGLLLAATFVIKEFRPARRLMLVSTGVALVVFLPYGLIFLQRATSSIAHGTWVKPHGPEEIWHMVRRWSNQPVVTLMLLVPLCVSLVREGMKPLIIRFGLLWWLLPLIGLWSVQPLVPAYVDRYLLFASLGFYLVAAHGLASLWRHGAAKLLTPICALGAMAFTFHPWVDGSRGTAKAAELLSAAMREEPNAEVLVHPFWFKLNVQWALDRSRFANPPWSDPWSPLLRTSPTDDTRSRLIITLFATDDPEWKAIVAEQTREHLPNQRELMNAGQVRVLRFVAQE